MTGTQRHLLRLLMKFDEICQREGIEYYLAGGSLVGAIRHGGFLPWDDDADVHMTRENVKRLKKAVDEMNDPNWCVYIKSEKGDYMNTHWRFVDCGSTQLIRSLTGSSGPQGQFIDIFALYPLPEGEEARERCLEDFEIYRELKSQNTVLNSRRSPEYLRRFRFFKRMEKIFGKKKVLEYVEKRIYGFPAEGAEEWFICAPDPPKRQVPIEMFGRPRYVDFEDTRLPVPEYAERFLAYEYGPAWFEVPPHMEREEHVFVQDFEIPYPVYTKEYSKYIDVDAFYAAEVRKKDFWYRMMPDRNQLNPQIRILQGIRTIQEIRNLIDEYHIDLGKLIKEGREEDIQRLFTSYFELINSESYRYWGLHVDLPDDMLSAVCWFGCFDGNYGMARKLLDKRRTQVDRPLTEDLERLSALCDATDELLYAMYGDLDFSRAAELTEEWLEKEPEALWFMRADVLLRMRGEGSGADEAAEDTLDRCEAYLKKYPEDGELLKYRGDLLLRKGEKEEGEACYRKALFLVKNGYCATAIRNYFQRTAS